MIVALNKIFLNFWLEVVYLHPILNPRYNYSKDHDVRTLPTHFRIDNAAKILV